MKKALRVTLVLAVGVLVLLACLIFRLPGSSLASPLLSYLPFTPEGETRRSGCGFFEPARSFQAHATYRVPDAVLVLFSAECPPEPGMQARANPGPILGVQRAQRIEGLAGMVAFQAGGGSATAAQPTPNEPLVFAADYGQGYAMVYGRALKPQVAVVEADFDNGESVHSEARRGLFSLFMQGAGAACELRALDKDGHVVQRVGPDDLAGYFLLPADQAIPANNCGH